MTTARISHRHASRFLAAVVGGVLLGTALLAATATASSASGPAARRTGHCVVDLVRSSTRQSAPTCFATFTQAISYATRGAVDDAPANSTKDTAGALSRRIEAANVALRQNAVPPRAALASLVIGTEYDLPNFSTASWSLTITGPAACTASTTDFDYKLDLPAPAWDQISSFQNFSNCRTDHYLGAGFTGLHTGFFASQSTMPFIRVANVFVNSDNSTRSLTWS